jgi:competence protein ComEA
LKSPVKNYLTLTKTEWNGLVVLVLLITAVIAAPYLYQRFHKYEPVNFQKFNVALAQLKRAGVTGNSAIDEEKENDLAASLKLFAFNPNNLPANQWQKLGLTARQIRGIKNYEAKGGKFYSKADVKKMYTITPQDYKRLQPYINLPEKEDVNKVAKPSIIVELNTVDSATLTTLNGIGPAFARRIVQYRRRLGGFHNKHQLQEIVGMDNMRYQDVQGQFTIDKRKVKRFNVNQIEFEDIKDFPYLNFKQMNAIIQYRKQHGNYELFGELGNIAILDKTDLKKIKPYVLIK